MKLILVCAFMCIGVIVFGQCSYYYLQNNKTITIGMFDNKGKDNGKYLYKISDVSKSGEVSTATVQSEVLDKKGKVIGGGKGTMQCKNGVLMIDMKTLLNPQQMQQFKNAKLEAKGAYMEYPASLSVGQMLPDGSFDMDIQMDGGLQSNVSIEVTNRKVEAKEKVTTPAGTWDAYKITYDSKTTITMGIAIPVKVQITEWFVPNFGMVKSSSKWGTQELLSVE